MRTVYETTQAGFAIKLKQSESGKIFQVHYGKQMDCTRSYSEAAGLLGQAIMHACACEGLLDNESPKD